jgi:hypothetical protein
MPTHLPSTSEAIRIIESTRNRPVVCADFRIVKSLCEYVDYSSERGTSLATVQRFEQSTSEERSVFSVRTELQTHVPVRIPGEGDQNQPRSMIRLEFAVGIIYVFGPEFSEIERVVCGKIYGVLHTYPYWRVFLHSSMTQMGSVSQIAAIIPLEQAARMAGFESGERDSESSSPKP